VSEWDVHLVFIEDKSKKFWRARKDETDLYVNWGRIGTDGQTQLKEFDSIEACESEYEKLVASKRKKGYVDQGDGDGGDEEPTELPGSKEPAKGRAGKIVDLALDGPGRKVDLRLIADGNTIRTVVVEKYKTPADAQAALSRIQQAMEGDGYRSVKRDEL
jgi:predicted DNA-binding WGR domain protein